MNFTTIAPDNSISLFAKSILVFEDPRKNQNTVLPFFADGYPGIIFQETENGLLVMPHHKMMPPLFVYGQTIKPVELHIRGSYKLIVFQLYPFVLKSFFNINAKDLNDDCYDLEQLENAKEHIQLLARCTGYDGRIEIITGLLSDIFETRKQMLDYTIRQGIQVILENKGQVSLHDLVMKLNITGRTFQRRFLTEVGILPKQFSQIVQFQQSLEQLMSKEYTKLTDVVYSNGYADQSHFIRVFKAFTGKTPKKFTAESM